MKQKTLFIILLFISNLSFANETAVRPCPNDYESLFKTKDKQEAPLKLTIKTDKLQYNHSDKIEIFYTIQNASDKDLKFNLSDSIKANINLINKPCEMVDDLPVQTSFNMPSSKLIRSKEELSSHFTAYQINDGDVYTYQWRPTGVGLQIEIVSKNLYYSGLYLTQPGHEGSVLLKESYGKYDLALKVCSEKKEDFANEIMGRDKEDNDIWEGCLESNIATIEIVK